MATVQSIERAFCILEKLSENPDGIQITRLAEQVNLSKSTVHRLLSTLIEMNYVSQDIETERYKVGYQVLFLSRNLLNNTDLIAIAKPFLQSLSHDINETIHLCIEDKCEIVYIDKIESNQTIRMYSRIGSRAPMYCTGVGKMLLSNCYDKELEKVLQLTSFERRTPHTITTRDDLLNELDIIRRQGYALDDIENEQGIRCIAAPIYNYTGRVISSFSISGPSERISHERIELELKEKILHTSKLISYELGFKA